MGRTDTFGASGEAERPTHRTRPLLMARRIMPTKQSEAAQKISRLPSTARTRKFRRK
jgi:hypothetical protein